MICCGKFPDLDGLPRFLMLITLCLRTHLGFPMLRRDHSATAEVMGSKPESHFQIRTNQWLG